MTQFSFAQFRATRIRCDDLGTALGDATLIEQDRPEAFSICRSRSMPTLYIEDADPGEYQLQLGEDIEVTSDLAGLERRLYQFAVDSGYIEADRFAAALENFASAAGAVPRTVGTTGVSRPAPIPPTCRHSTSS